MVPADIKIESEKETKSFGRFVIAPLNPGYGRTLGNTLRRILLSSLAGAALTEVKIGGVGHEFSTIKGVGEDVVDILLNLKGVRLKMEVEKAVLRLEKKGKGEVRAGDLEKVAGVEIVNPEHLIATITDPKTKLSMELTAQQGVGYSPSEERKSGKVGVITLDAIFTPILAVNYTISPTRVAQITNLDKLTLEITTDETIKPSEALKKAAQTLRDYFFRLTQDETEVAKLRAEQKRKEEEIKLGKEIKSLPIEELELPTRLTNSLIKGRVKTIGDLLKKEPEAWAKIKNVGEKSTEEIKKALKKKGWTEK